MRFTKMHGIGNDFVLVEAWKGDERDWPRLARTLCDRHFGVGGDGLLLVLPSREADFRMRMFNPDGSEAEMCGNGVRCFGKYLFDRGLFQSTSLQVETLQGIQHLDLQVASGVVTQVRVWMGLPRLAAAEIPVASGPEVGVAHGGPGGDIDFVTVKTSVSGMDLDLTCVSMGNPHAVAFLDTPVASFPLPSIGPLVEHHPLFPARVNFEIVNVVGPGALKMRVWERGAGETLACGTGACAVAVAAFLRSHTDGAVQVQLPGGVLQIQWNGAGQVQMTGPAVTVFEGDWPDK